MTYLMLMGLQFIITGRFQTGVAVLNFFSYRRESFTLLCLKMIKHGWQPKNCGFVLINTYSNKLHLSSINNVIFLQGEKVDERKGESFSGNKILLFGHQHSILGHIGDQ